MTDLLRARCQCLTCLEVDPVFALPLRQRISTTRTPVQEPNLPHSSFRRRGILDENVEKSRDCVAGSGCRGRLLWLAYNSARLQRPRHSDETGRFRRPRGAISRSSRVLPQPEESRAEFAGKHPRRNGTFCLTPYT